MVTGHCGFPSLSVAPYKLFFGIFLFVFSIALSNLLFIFPKSFLRTLLGMGSSN